jgi:aspartyl-tRNA synthetase
MFRTHTCGELRPEHQGQTTTLAGWVQRVRNLGAVIFIDLRDRYGITQISLAEEAPEALKTIARALGREDVLQVTGTVALRTSANPQLPTGAIEVVATQLNLLNSSALPPFTIEDQTDGGEDLRMRYRYLDIRRKPVRDNLLFRDRVGREVRQYLANQGFVDVETPFLIKSTPEGARDFVVPSRVHAGQFYALPQSPQTFKQLLMVAGMDRYYQIVRCFRDEDLRADRQPEFTQIDCELAFVEQEDILYTFEGLLKHLLLSVHNLATGPFPRMSYAEAMERYGSDKPDIRFGMEIQNLTTAAQGHGFKVFDDAELIGGLVITGGAELSRKQIDQWTEWVKRPQIGMGGLAWVRFEAADSAKSSIDKFYTNEQLVTWLKQAGAQPGDLMVILSGAEAKTRKALGDLRLMLGQERGLRTPGAFAPLWVVDFPLLEWDEESGRYHAMHHPFTSPKPEDIHLLESNPGQVRANAYDLVLNGAEIGGGSIRIHNRALQQTMFNLLGFTPEEAQNQFGFLLNAFEYGAPPHGGIAFGFDRLVAILAGQETIRDFIAFPKNNAGRDVMIDAPSPISEAQKTELSLATLMKQE